MGATGCVTNGSRARIQCSRRLSLWLIWPLGGSLCNTGARSSDTSKVLLYLPPKGSQEPHRSVPFRKGQQGLQLWGALILGSLCALAWVFITRAGAGQLGV